MLPLQYFGSGLFDVNTFCDNRKTRSHECERCTHECVRHILLRCERDAARTMGHI
jgi:hypothetical protein